MRINLASWNVNGIRAVSKKEAWSWFENTSYDVIGLQETKASVEQLPSSLIKKEGYESFFASSVVKKGYSGTAVYSRLKPINVEIELPESAFQGEGRIVHLEFEKFHFFNGYFPNGGAPVVDDKGNEVSGEFIRVPYKMGFFESFFDYAQKLRQKKPVVVCGDFNIAHKEIDLARPQQNVKNTGFLPVERQFLDRFVAAGYVDTFRLKHPDELNCYTWWSYKNRARPLNIGWRIDYFFVSEELKDNVVEAFIEDDVLGSDHCPIGLVLEI